MDGDRQLQETLKWLAGPVDRRGVWASIEARAGGVGGDRGTGRGARAKRHVLRTAVFATLAAVLVAAIAIGSAATIRHYGQPNFVLRITDDNVMGAANQPATEPVARDEKRALAATLDHRRRNHQGPVRRSEEPFRPLRRNGRRPVQVE